MKKAKKIAENIHYSAVDIGNIADLNDYALIHPKSGREVRGKVFLKELTHATGTEISFTTIAPHSELGYFHHHVKDEETYIILKGTGYYQVNDDYFPIKEGSVIRVAPEGARSLCNTSDAPMVYLCIQSKKDSLEEHSIHDGDRVDQQTKWPEM